MDEQNDKNKSAAKLSKIEVYINNKLYCLLNIVVIGFVTILYIKKRFI